MREKPTTLAQLDRELYNTYEEIRFSRKAMSEAKLAFEQAKRDYADAFDFLAIEQEALKDLLAQKESMCGIPDWEPVKQLTSNTH